MPPESAALSKRESLPDNHQCRGERGGGRQAEDTARAGVIAIGPMPRYSDY